MDSTKDNAMTNGSDNKQEVYDNIIVGGGPGGLNLALEFAVRNIPYVLLEQQPTFGGQFRRFPRCGELISLNKKHLPVDAPGWLYARRYDWHTLSTVTEEDAKKDPKVVFTNWSDALFPQAIDLANYLDYIGHHPTWHVIDNTRFNCRVTCVTSDDSNLFIVKTNGGETFKARRVFMGTGTSRSVVPNIRGVLEHAIFYRDFDPTDVERYRNKRVIILGGGNSAFEVAHSLRALVGDLTIVARSGVKFARQTHNVHDVRTQSSVVYDLSQLKSLSAICSHRITDIERREDGRLVCTSRTPEPLWNKQIWRTTKIVVDEFIVCCGFEYTVPDVFNTDRVKPERDCVGKFCKLTSTWESTNVPNLYFIGGSMRVNDLDAASGFIHGFRYNIKALASVIGERYHKQPIKPIFECVVDPKCDKSFKPLTQFIIELVSSTASLFELFKYSCSVITFETIPSSDGMMTPTYKVQVWEVLPIEYARERWAKKNNTVGHVEIIFQYGFRQFGENVPTHDFTHVSDHFRAEESVFIHPVLHAYRHDSDDVTKYPDCPPGKVEEWHLKETLLARWDDTRGGGPGSNPDLYVNAIYNAVAAALGMPDRKNILPVHPEFIDHAYPPMTPEEIQDAIQREPPLRIVLEANPQIMKKLPVCNMMKAH